MIKKQRTTKTNLCRRGLGVLCRDMCNLQSKRSVSKLLLYSRLICRLPRANFHFHIEEVAKYCCLEPQCRQKDFKQLTMFLAIY